MVFLNVLDELDFGSEYRILDFGCGIGIWVMDIVD